MYSITQKIQSVIIAVVSLALFGGLFMAQPAQAASDEERLETIEAQVRLIRNVVAAFSMMRPAEYPLVVAATSTIIENQRRLGEVSVHVADIELSTAVLADLNKSREAIHTQMTDVRARIVNSQARLTELSKAVDALTGATSTREVNTAIAKTQMRKLSSEITQWNKMLTNLERQRADVTSQVTELLTKIKHKQGNIQAGKRQDNIDQKTLTKTRLSNAKPVCKITTDKQSYVLGDTVTFSWTSRHATGASWRVDDSGKDNFVMPTTASTTGSHSIEADVLGNPSVTLLVTRNTAKNYCSKKVKVRE